MEMLLQAKGLLKKYGKKKTAVIGIDVQLPPLLLSLAVFAAIGARGRYFPLGAAHK